MKFEFKIDSGNQAIQEPSEVARLLRKIANLVDSMPRAKGLSDSGTLRDVNGTSVGSWFIQQDHDE